MATKKQDLVYRGIEIINACVEQLETWEDRSDAIAQLRAHLEARAEQCRPEPPYEQRVEMSYGFHNGANPEATVRVASNEDLV